MASSNGARTPLADSGAGMRAARDHTLARVLAPLPRVLGRPVHAAIESHDPGTTFAPARTRGGFGATWQPPTLVRVRSPAVRVLLPVCFARDIGLHLPPRTLRTPHRREAPDRETVMGIVVQNEAVQYECGERFSQLVRLILSSPAIRSSSIGCQASHRRKLGSNRKTRSCVASLSHWAI
jgi:hypothetical protein